MRGISVADYELSRAAKHLIITTERIVDEAEIRDDPSATSIPFFMVDAVVEVPNGSYPGNMPYLYFSDEDYLAEWLRIEKDPAEFEKFFKKQVLDTRNFNEYLELNGGIDKIIKLRSIEHLIDRK